MTRCLNPATLALAEHTPSRRPRLVLAASALVLLAMLEGCATTHPRDPLEPWNRQVFAFNEAVDANVLKPVAEGYNVVTPEPVRTGVRNFFNNLRDVWSVVNLFMQGRMADGAQGVMRVSANTVLGLAGFIDIATPMQLPRPNEDLGQTLGVWGMGPGPYIVWPFLGPSTLRDSLNIPVEMQFSGGALTQSSSDAAALTALSVVSLRASLLDATNLFADVALDKYSFTRDAYLQRRQNLIYEGDPPDEPPLDDDPPAAGPDAAAVPAPAGASSPSAKQGGPEASASWAKFHDGDDVTPAEGQAAVSEPAWALFPFAGAAPSADPRPPLQALAR
jgi:phospholipid-binding lipoprotein MlaA